MSKKISSVLFYLSLIITFGILICYFFRIILIFETIKYCLIFFSFTIHFLIVKIEEITNNLLSKSISIGLNLIGLLIWNLSLLEFFQFDKTWNSAFLFMLFGLISSLFFFSTKRSSKMMKILTLFSFFMLVIVIYNTGNSVFDNSIILLSILLLFTLFSLISLLSESSN
jgi:hypothetical protein